MLAGVLGLGCDAQLGAGARSDDAGSTTSDKSQAQCTESSPGESGVRRITALQYHKAVESLFGSVEFVDSFPKSQLGKGFRSDADANIVTLDGAAGIQTAAESIAANVSEDWQSLTGCSQASDEACITDFIRDLTRRAYRRPATTGESTRLQQIYDEIRVSIDAPAAVRSVVEVVLQSPESLYIVETIPEGASTGDVVERDAWSLASRLSFLIAHAPPDEELLALAESGALNDVAVIREQTLRLLDEADLRPLLSGFFHDWLETWHLDEVDKNPDEYPHFERLRPQMEEQLTRFAQNWAKEGGSVVDLLTSTQIPMTTDLAAIYEVTAPQDAWSTVTVDGARQGILTLPVFLAAHANSASSSPVKRGTFVREGLLCQDLVPPAGIDVNLPVSKPGQSVRERLATHASDPSCAGCHDMIDPPGFALENFDAIGKWRTEEETGAPVDASGELIRAGSASGSFDGPDEMIAILAQSDLIAECFAEKWVHYLLSRAPETQDACTTAQVQQAARESGGDFRSLLLAMTTSDALLYRRIPETAE